MADSGWIGVDLDGTLARYNGWQGHDHIGAPIPEMCDRVRQWIVEGVAVRIFTARVANDPFGEARDAIHKWCEAEFGLRLPVTNTKDYGMIELWDDRCIRVVPNTGRPCCSPTPDPEAP